MNDEVIAFLEEFFAAEQTLLERHLKPNLQAYNDAVDAVARYAVPELKNSFGAKLAQLRDAEYYERVKDWPPPAGRVLFRIDTHEAPDGAPLYSCLVSNSKPRKAKVFARFIVKRTDGALKIDATFHLTDNGMGGAPQWYFGGGDKRYLRIVENEYEEGEYLLDEASLGRKIATERLTEPVATDAAGLAEYHRN
ncbi:MAG: hypothetical protein MJA82_16530 [Clostridia bacterium]|nr:hypothetical protein [Clostridia bacterium]